MNQQEYQRLKDQARQEYDATIAAIERVYRLEKTYRPASETADLPGSSSMEPRKRYTRGVKRRVVEQLSDDWISCEAIAERTGLTHKQVFGVIHQRSFKPLLEQKRDGPAYEYRLKPGAQESIAVGQMAEANGELS